jgi:uncharacterized membrane protein YsdA (DUF1294 family)
MVFHKRYADALVKGAVGAYRGGNLSKHRKMVWRFASEIYL